MKPIRYLFAASLVLIPAETMAQQAAGPAYQWPGAVRAADRPQPEAWCGATHAPRAPDVMTYDRTTRTEVMVGDADGRTSVTALNRGTGSTFHADGDLSQAGTPYVCTVDNVKGTGHAIAAGRGGEPVMIGYDDASGRRWIVTDPDHGVGPDYRVYDSNTGRQTEAVTDSSGKTKVQSWDPSHENGCFFGALSGKIPHTQLSIVLGGRTAGC